MLTRLSKCYRMPLSRCFASDSPWKPMDYYYSLEFADKPRFIPHLERYPVFRILDTNGKVVSPIMPEISSDTLHKALEVMIRGREMDYAYNNAQRQSRISLYIGATGEEAVSVASAAALKKQDGLFLQYRELPMLLWRGMTTLEVMYNLKGTKEDLTLGKAMPMTFADPNINVYSSSAPVGNRNSHASGAGYHYRVKNMDKVAFCIFGEGAASEGCFHASMNFAATLGSQSLFLCRNNGFAISTFVNEQYAGDGIAPRGPGYGIPAVKVDGNDFLAMYYIVQEARKITMERKGPVLIEAFTYRAGDHSTSDSADMYKKGPIMEKVKEYSKMLGDPILRLGKYMQGKGMIKNAEERIKEISKKERAQCIENVKKLDEMVFPHYDNMFKGVYKETPWNLIESQEELHELVKKYPEGYPLEYFEKKS